MLDDKDNAARWVWCDPDIDVSNRYAIFRRTFTLPAMPGPTTLDIYADSRYWLYVNGVRVGFGPGRHPEDSPQFDRWDISPLVQAGPVLVACRVHSIGPVHRCSSFIPRRCSLIASIAWNGGCIVTDAAWRGTADPAYQTGTPRISNHQSFVECVDARRALVGWEQPGLDDSQWPAVYEIPADRMGGRPPLALRPVPALTLTPRRPVRIIDRGRSIPINGVNPERLETAALMMFEADRIPDAESADPPTDLLPVSIKAPDDPVQAGYRVFDFGQNGAGYLVLDIEGTPGTVIDCAYGEHMDDGRVHCAVQGIRFNDRLILGTGRFHHQVLMPRTFQFLLMEVRQGQATIHRIEQELSTYPVTWRGSFAAPESRLLTQAWRTAAYTVQLCMEDVYMDNPRRERGGWLGDMVPEAMGSYHAFGDYRLARHALALFARSQRPDGRVIVRYPSIQGASHPNYISSFVFALRDYVAYSGDTEFARSMWPVVRHITAWFEGQRRPDDLLVVYPSSHDLKHYPENYGTIFVDWAPCRLDGVVTSMNIIHAGYLREAAGLANLLGFREEASALQALHERSRKAIQTKLFDRSRGLFVNCLTDAGLSRQAGYQENLLALGWNIADAEQEKMVAHRLLPTGQPLPMWVDERFAQEAVGKGKFAWDSDEPVPIGSAYFDYDGVAALFEMGRGLEARLTLEHHYGYMLARGASTTWEDWKGDTTRSQGYGAAPVVHAGKYILGVSPDEPGFRRFSVLPVFAGLPGARGRVPTPLGIIQVEWRQEHTHDAWLDVLVPQGTSARIGLPDGSPAANFLLDGMRIQPDLLPLRRGTYHTTAVGPGRHRLQQVFKQA
jgi:alpha-L-rhamnosidase